MAPTKRTEPTDNYDIFYIAFAILGSGVLIGWNVIITAAEFFELAFGPGIEFTMSCVFNYANVLMLLFNIKLGARFKFSTRIVTTLVVDIVGLLVLPFLKYFIDDIKVQLYITLGAIFVMGICNGILMGAAMSMASLFPPRYMSAMMTGCGLSGIIAGGLRAITKASLPVTEVQKSTEIFFLTAVFVLGLCIVFYYLVAYSKFGSYYMNPHSVELSEESEEGERERETAALLNPAEGPTKYNATDNGVAEPEESREEATTWETFQKIWTQSLGVFLVFFVSLALFPGVTTQIQSSNAKFLPNGWFTLALLSTFLVFDFTGRVSTKWVPLVPPSGVLLPILLRCGFIPLFVLCVKPKLFVWNGYPFIFMMFMALTNGYLSTCTMMHAPSLVPPQDRATVGAIMSFFMNFGVLAGSNFALIFTVLLV